MIGSTNKGIKSGKPVCERRRGGKPERRASAQGGD